MGLVTKGLFLGPLAFNMVAIARPLDARGAEPTMPYDSNTTPGCIWWWDNDGFLTCEERVNTWGITFEEFFLWVSTDLPSAHLGE